jgi:uncharacterized protein YutE (UPF0331/DUF86 family)
MYSNKPLKSLLTAPLFSLFTSLFTRLHTRHLSSYRDALKALENRAHLSEQEAARLKEDLRVSEDAR